MRDRRVAGRGGGGGESEEIWAGGTGPMQVRDSYVGGKRLVRNCGRGAGGRLQAVLHMIPRVSRLKEGEGSKGENVQEVWD